MPYFSNIPLTVLQLFVLFLLSLVISSCDNSRSNKIFLTDKLRKEKNDEKKQNCIFPSGKKSFNDKYFEFKKNSKNFTREFSHEISKLLKSNDLNDVSKALVYSHWIEPEVEIAQLCNALIENEKIIKRPYPLLIYMYDVNFLYKDQEKFKQSLHSLECDFNHRHTKFINHLFKNIYFAHLNNYNYYPKMLEETFDYLVPILSENHLKELVNNNNLIDNQIFLDEVIRRIGEKYRNLSNRKEDGNENNKLSYKLSEYFAFLQNDMYRCPSLDTIISKFSKDIINGLITLKDCSYSYNPGIYKYYYFTCKFLSKNCLMFFDGEQIEWINTLSKWIENTINDCNYIIKNSKISNDGFITFSNYELNHEIAEIISALFQLWNQIDPNKYLYNLINYLSDTQLRKYYQFHVFTGDVFYNFFYNSPFFFTNIKFYIKKFLEFVKVYSIPKQTHFSTVLLNKLSFWMSIKQEMKSISDFRKYFGIYK